ncbi:hypothetical protein [Pseudomonas sp. TNT3]|uniref:hypothetical protein n=1 Tax=Pseudomonas sp. TNT3 TaxID=2654097 RepID=UPI00139074DF|nr:hypothetical protein [Pseudomonas sp. TNT3]KAI2670444.1 hypothetical protein GBC55_025725 [Pseudomonas sp. TNT3]
MPVDHRALPEKMALPLPPGKGRWLLVILMISLLGGGLVAVLWPTDQWGESLWFWCCVLIFPSLSGVLLFALRLLAYERQVQFAQSWNESHTDQEQRLVKQGQRAIGLLATSYGTPAGTHQLSQALLNGSKPLQPVFLKRLVTTLRLSQLKPAAQNATLQEYKQRLESLFSRLMRDLQEELQQLANHTACRLRIKHNQIMPDAAILSLLRSCTGDHLVFDEVLFATQADGVLWLDAWLDEPEPFALVLSIEVNLFQEPIAEQAESVSGVLLAHPGFCAKHRVVPQAWVHRPVGMTDDTNSLKDVLLWGRIQEGGEPYFVWQSQIPADHLGDVSIAMCAAGHALDNERCHRLDDSFGLPGYAVGNVALIVASEYAASERQPQLAMLNDISPHWCVVRPAG